MEARTPGRPQYSVDKFPKKKIVLNPVIVTQTSTLLPKVLPRGYMSVHFGFSNVIAILAYFHQTPCSCLKNCPWSPLSDAQWRWLHKNSISPKPGYRGAYHVGRRWDFVRRTKAKLESCHHCLRWELQISPILWKGPWAQGFHTPAPYELGWPPQHSHFWFPIYSMKHVCAVYGQSQRVIWKSPFSLQQTQDIVWHQLSTFIKLPRLAMKARKVFSKKRNLFETVPRDTELTQISADRSPTQP